MRVEDCPIHQSMNGHALEPPVAQWTKTIPTIILVVLQSALNPVSMSSYCIRMNIMQLTLHQL